MYVIILLYFYEAFRMLYIHLQVIINDYIKKTLDKRKRKGNQYIDDVVMSMSRHGGEGPGYWISPVH